MIESEINAYHKKKQKKQRISNFNFYRGPPKKHFKPNMSTGEMAGNLL